MPGSFTCVHYHIIFSTKYREPTLRTDRFAHLFQYIGGILRQKGGKLVSAGGMPDHVHLLTAHGAQQALADAVRDIKSNSSRWLREQFADEGGFAWREGYGAFAVSYSHLNRVKDYLARQAEHHQTRSFQEEFVAFLERHGIEYDDRYLWD